MGSLLLSKRLGAVIKSMLLVSLENPSKITVFLRLGLYFKLAMVIISKFIYCQQENL